MISSQDESSNKGGNKLRSYEFIQNLFPRGEPFLQMLDRNAAHLPNFAAAVIR